MNRFGIIFILAFAAANLVAFELDVTPRPDGSIDTFFSVDWNYSESPFFSGIRGSFTTAQSDDTDASSYIATVERQLTVEADVLGIRLGSGSMGLNVSANGEYDHMIIREIGYLDSGSTRYFVLNDRIIDLYLPRVKAEASLRTALGTLKAGGEYAPWFYTNLNQELTISPLFPKKSNVSGQAGTNAFSIFAEITLGIPSIEPTLEATYDNVALVYSALTTAGLMSLDTMIEDITVKGTFALKFIDLNGLRPAILVQWESVTTTDRITGKQISVDSEWRFGVGLR